MTPAPTAPPQAMPAPTPATPQATPPPQAPPSPPPPAAVPPPPPRPRTALFVAGNSANLSAADEKLVDELERLTFMVKTADDNGPVAEADGVGVVVISASSAQNTVAGKFRDTPVPIVVLESYIFGEMGMTGNAQDTDFGANTGTQIAITASGSPLAAGLTGNVAICTANGSIHWGVPGAGAEAVAALANNQQRVAVFAYEKGAAMTGLAAPARRVGFFASQTVSDRLNDNGLKLFGAAVEWAWSASANKAPVQ